jgi:hypothetical protein
MRRLLALGAILATSLVASAPAPTNVTSHTCSSSYTHAVLSYGHRCLRRGQFCSLGEQSRYRIHGFRCTGGRLR